MKLDARVCPQCKEKFLPINGKEKFCGRRCYVEYLREGGWKQWQNNGVDKK